MLLVLYNLRKSLKGCSENKGTDQQLICVFVFAYAKSRFSHNEAHMLLVLYNLRKSLKGFYFRHIQTADLGVTLHRKTNTITLSYLKSV